MRTLRLLPALAVATAACQQPSQQFAWVDRPQTTPIPLESLPTSERAGKSVQDSGPVECSSATGRTKDGSCVLLRTRDLEHVQRVQIPQGKFAMGERPQGAAVDPEGPAAIRWPGQPPRMAAVDSFWIDLHEVSRRAYQECVQQGQCTPAECADADPVADVDPERAPLLPQTCVTHEQAQVYCQAHEGRLPTAAEWEYAARGIDGRRYAWGNDLRDELTAELYPVTVRLDASYFGILGLSSNAMEWVLDVYQPEAALEFYVEGDFRAARGPLRRARREFETRLACGTASRCAAATQQAAERRVVKMGRPGTLQAGRVVMPAHPAPTELEGWPLATRHPRWGFRCAADLAPEDESLTVPATPVPPVVVLGDGEQWFAGVAEAVNRSEAERFCQTLRVPVGDETRDDWRLPTMAELDRLAADLAVHGPLWTRDGAAVRMRPSGKAEDDSWQAGEFADAEPLLATCVRGRADEPVGITDEPKTDPPSVPPAAGGTSP